MEEIQQRCKINQYDFQLVIKEYNIKGNTKYHTEIKSGKKTSIHKYSEDFAQRLEKLLKTDSEVLKKLREKVRKRKIIDAFQCCKTDYFELTFFLN